MDHESHNVIYVSAPAPTVTNVRKCIIFHKILQHFNHWEWNGPDK